MRDPISAGCFSRTDLLPSSATVVRSWTMNEREGKAVASATLIWPVLPPICLIPRGWCLVSFRDYLTPGLARTRGVTHMRVG